MSSSSKNSMDALGSQDMLSEYERNDSSGGNELIFKEKTPTS